MNERLSAWMDGELSDDQARQLPLQLKRFAELRSTWNYYHLVGDALRGVQGPDLCARICARLDTQLTVLAPQHCATSEMRHWRPMQMAASIAVMLFVGGIWMALLRLQPDSPQIAAIPASEVGQVAAPAGEGARGYLLAHQHYSPSNAFQGLAVYARTVSQEMPLRADPVVR